MVKREGPVVKKDAHYYAMLGFCRGCGFDKESALTLAYASQFVDDAKINLMFIKNPNKKIQYEIVGNRPAFFNIATCHYYFKIKTFNYEAMINNTCAFHFVPGCQGDNFSKKLRCAEESPVIVDILEEALLEDNLIKFGVALHSYADSFSHQGFSGLLSKVNDIKNCRSQNKEYFLGIFDGFLNTLEGFGKQRYEKLFDTFVPCYGHSQALDYPDLPYLEWSYKYDQSSGFYNRYRETKIDNRDRYSRAFKRIRSYLQRFLSKHNHYRDSDLEYDNFDLLLKTLTSKKSDWAREANWIRVLVTSGLFNKRDLDLIIYKEDQWLKEAFCNYSPKTFNNRTIKEVELAADFSDSHWYQFYLAVKWYKRKFFEYCRKYGLVFPN
jgi:hypothetical protein